MEEGTREVEAGLNSTSKAGGSLKQIIHASEQVGEMITQIAAAALEQSSATEQVNRNMEQIAGLVKESAGVPGRQRKHVRIYPNWRSICKSWLPSSSLTTILRTTAPSPRAICTDRR